ncbi:MAG TPA: alkaline phosphatase family protein [Rhodocyclaceae bacterium]
MNANSMAPSGSILSDYAGGSLVNLMQSVQSLLQAAPAIETYAPLDPRHGLGELAGTAPSHIMLVVIDGVGCRQLDEHAPSGWLEANRRSTLTSVFPSTTASAIPCFLSGLAPRCHGLLGWQIRDEVSGEIVNTFPLTQRSPGGATPLSPPAVARVLSYPPLVHRLPGAHCTIAPAEIAGSDFNQAHSGGGPMIGYRDLAGFEEALQTACDYHRVAGRHFADTPGFTYAYCPWPDTLMHRLGVSDPRVGEAIRGIDGCLSRLHARERGNGLAMIVTADHGFIDAPPERLIEIDADGLHADWLGFLDAPLWGERRVAFASVAPEQHDGFVRFVADRYAHALDLLSADDFLAGPWLGSGQAHPALRQRLGDFVLLLKDDWTIKDWLPGERRYQHLGVHSGASSDEMYVPLIVAS